ncbi:MAG: AraC family transcriptional regulator [Eubacteriales bacterium]
MKNYSIGMHCQGFYEINIVLGGTGRHYINDSRVDVSEGCIFIIPPNMMHGYMGSEGFDVFHLLLSPEFLNRYISDFYKLPSFFTLFELEPVLRTKESFVPSLVLKNERFDEVRQLIDKMLQYSEQNTRINMLLVNSYAATFILRLCDIYGSEVKIQPKDQQFMDSLSLIYCNYNEKITVERLSSAALMSRSAYLKRFSEILGTTPGRLLVSRRIAAAKELLAATQYSLDKIAELTGFYDASHFVRFFEKSEGITPSEYRKGSL